MEKIVENQKTNARTARFGLRATVQQESLIRAAAEATGKSVTQFVLNSACDAAENALANQRHFFVDEERWMAFMEALEKPAEIKPRLSKLMRSHAPWEE